MEGTETVAWIAALVAGGAAFIALIAANYSRRQAEAAEGQVAAARVQVDLMHDQAVIAQEQLTESKKAREAAQDQAEEAKRSAQAAEDQVRASADQVAVMREQLSIEHRIEQRRAVIEILSKTTEWSRASRVLLLNIERQGRSALRNAESAARFNAAERDFLDSLTAGQLIVTNSSVSRDISLLANLHQKLGDLLAKIVNSNQAEFPLYIRTCHEIIDQSKEARELLRKSAARHYVSTDR
ncbi:hypothetical protein [Umezawaea sp. Da 62-37]|uniref:hypothetical protein n=1 Tax=Umezawaea sp. Da 62-37 TaxID=3075927 RepID=UPI0028F71D1B|nr:hypothetical protein [Umezawaea sp. Da 62-37]WNV83701.1 hypothetical protein RM788_36795 [Umezawaea sp. Da 62-37]